MINWNDPKEKIGKYFTVGEATKNCTRIPETQELRFNIVLLAGQLDKVREAWGSPLIVTSWYRPPAVNKAVGGVSNSTHLQGYAADVYPANGKLKEFQAWVDKHWYGALGYGLKKGFVHLDMRNGLGFFKTVPPTKGTRWDY